MDIKNKILQQLNHLRNYEDLDYAGLRTLKIIENLLEDLIESYEIKLKK